MVDLVVIMLAIGVLMVLVGITLGEARRARRAGLIQAIIVALYAYIFVQSRGATGEAALVEAIWGSVICLTAFVGLGIGYLVGTRRRAETPG